MFADARIIRSATETFGAVCVYGINSFTLPVLTESRLVEMPASAGAASYVSVAGNVKQRPVGAGFCAFARRVAEGSMNDQQRARVEALRQLQGGTHVALVPFSLDDESSSVAVILEFERPYVDLSNTVLTRLINNSDPRFFEVIASIVADAFERELSDREEMQSRRAAREYQTVARGKGRGYVYVLKSEDGHYKIGRTANLDTRIKSISTSSPQRIQLTHAFKAINPAAQESALHAMYADKRVRGEWFALTSDDVVAIRKLGDEW